MKNKEEQLAEECYKNRIKMETREKQGAGKKIPIDTVFDFLRLKMERTFFVIFFL